MKEPPQTQEEWIDQVLSALDDYVARKIEESHREKEGGWISTSAGASDALDRLRAALSGALSSPAGPG